ncbi:peptidase M1 family protein [gamma proteobacterium NOR5-3]|nr:peptidase M1 family protein [gamma proteobacterium NOR5-3]
MSYIANPLTYARAVLGSCLFASALSGCSSQMAEDSTAVPASVINALEAAARGEPHPEDMHPDTARSGKAMTALQAAFDVKHYTLALKIMPETRSIEGSVAVSFEALSALNTLQLDLDPKLDIHKAMLGDTQLKVRREGGSFTVTLPSTLDAGTNSTVTVSYGGKPHIAMAPPWHGGFVWSEVEDTPWFATAVQGDGCDLWWPCKDNFADKPDEGVDLAITAPKGVKIASVGVLTGIDEGDDGFDTWHWQSRHPYSGYAVAINGGPFELVEAEYAGINGTRYPIQFWALTENADKARALIDSDVIPDLEFFERILGPYPWGDEKAGFVETPHLGMEHQTINGYGEQYKRGSYGFDGLLHHELAHEWFGNVMTHARPEDAWLHEGYGAYMQAVYAEETVGAIGYFHHMYNAYTNNEHCLPVANPAVEDAGEAFDNRDIYTKGSWMLHSLRRYMGEEAFWAGTRRVIYDTAEPWSLSYPIQSRYRSTEDFIAIMSDEAGEDIAWIVETYLREAGMPALISSRNDAKLSLEWSVPGDRDFPMPVDVSIDGEVQVVDLSAGPQSIAVPKGARVLIDPDSKILRSLPIIGDCSEQTDEQIQHNIDRFTRMAKDYGWQRD